MAHYRVTIAHDACTTHEIDADSPNAAADAAMSEVYTVRLCHQCSGKIELADPIRVVGVHNDETDEYVTDLDPPIEAVVLQRELDEVLAERTALLEALIGMEVLFAPLSRDCTQHDAVDRARAAIAFVTGEKK
jgi:hypothetical protein